MNTHPQDTPSAEQMLDQALTQALTPPALPEGFRWKLMAAMQRHKDEIARCSKPRQFEETMRLLRSGQAERSVTMLHEQGLLAPVLPALATFLDESLADQRVDAFVALLGLGGGRRGIVRNHQPKVVTGH